MGSCCLQSGHYFNEKLHCFQKWHHDVTSSHEVFCNMWSFYIYHTEHLLNEPVHEISNNVVCVTSKASDQPAHTRSLIRAFASHLSIL